MQYRDVPIGHLAATDATSDWDKRVETWEEMASSDAFRRLAEEVVAAACPLPSDRAIDLGAGTGLLALALAPDVEHVLAIDTSRAMLNRLAENARRAAFANVETRIADLRLLPVEDESVSLVVSNYAFHHLDDVAKELALGEARRILRPGGRLVVCDMMFALSLAKRDRELIARKLWMIARRGPSGIARITSNAARLATGRWEKPAPPDRWSLMLARRRFTDISVRLLDHEAGLATARRPLGKTPSAGDRTAPMECAPPRRAA